MQWQSKMGYPKVRFIVAMACACALVYILSFMLMSPHPGYWNTCSPQSCTPLASPLQTNDYSQRAISMEDEFESVVSTKHEMEVLASAPQLQPQPKGTDISRIVFGIAAAADMWEARKEYIKLWWKPEMRGFVWLDEIPDGAKLSDEYPPFKVSQNTSEFEYTYKGGWRSAIRISRIVSETFRLGLPDVDWFVLGDDDTLFFTENLVQVLSKYDHSKKYYIGSNSESHLQNIMFSYNMAFGGGGIAISYPLVKLLATMQDSCIARYPHLFGSDDRLHACMTELGIPLTKEPGFHQFDMYGDAYGILAAHPVVPLVSIHHLDFIDPIFPNTLTKNYTRLDALNHLLEAANLEAASTMQQSICYDKLRRWSFTVSWGYVVQVYQGFITPRELEVPQKTFLSWHKETSNVQFPFNTRSNSDDVCKRPTRFFMESVQAPSMSGSQAAMESLFLREASEEKKGCTEKLLPLSAVQRIKVVREFTDQTWYQSPRRSCCRVRSWMNEDIDIHVGACKDGETLVSTY
ncbi:hypothetical protein M758_2G065700 [Ceratodon purpureus]|nr:hypothetical protein M758_2G065700 [Ceratodon purpureus]